MAPLSTGFGIGLTNTPSKGGGVPALAWRFANNTPVKRAEGGFWMRAS